MDIKGKIGLKIKSLREEKNFSMEQLANISNVDRNYISDIERGQRNVSITILDKIIQSLDTDWSTFFKDSRFQK